MDVNIYLYHNTYDIRIVSVVYITRWNAVSVMHGRSYNSTYKEHTNSRKATEKAI